MTLVQAINWAAEWLSKEKEEATTCIFQEKKTPRGWTWRTQSGEIEGVPQAMNFRKIEGLKKKDYVQIMRAWATTCGYEDCKYFKK